MATYRPTWSRNTVVSELEATGPERLGWRVNVETDRGIEAYGVLVAPSHDTWRARILTLPNILWLGPDRRSTIKFEGRTPREAEQRAADFIRDHCRSKQFLMRDELCLIAPDEMEREAVSKETGNPDRKVRFLPVLFGLRHPAERGGTGNMSEKGMFIITEDPANQGDTLHLRLKMETREIDLTGRVRWARKAHRIGRAPGMGVELLDPPLDYVNYVRALA